MTPSLIILTHTRGCVYFTERVSPCHPLPSIFLLAFTSSNPLALVAGLLEHHPQAAEGHRLLDIAPRDELVGGLGSGG